MCLTVPLHAVSQGYYKPPSGTGGTATNFDVNMAVSSGGGTKASSTQYFELYDYVRDLFHAPAYVHVHACK